MEELFKWIVCSFMFVVLSVIGLKLLWIVCVLLLRLVMVVALPLLIIQLILQKKNKP